MAEILNELKVFYSSPIGIISIFDVFFLITAYIIRPRTPIKNWWKHWKALAVFFVIIWLSWASVLMDRPFVKQETFDSLTRMEGILKHNDDDGTFLIMPDAGDKKIYQIYGYLFDYEADFRKYYEQDVVIWEKNHIVHQFECNGKMIYTLEHSNNRIWLGVLWDFMTYYSMLFCGLLMIYFAILNFIKNIKEGVYEG